MVKDFTAQHTQYEVEFYMGMVVEEQQSLEGLIEYLKVTFQSGEMLSELMSDYYSQSQKVQDTEDAFSYNLQVLARKLLHGNNLFI